LLSLDLDIAVEMWHALDIVLGIVFMN